MPCLFARVVPLARRSARRIASRGPRLGFACALLAACADASGVEWGAVEQLSGGGGLANAGTAGAGTAAGSGRVPYADEHVEFDPPGACAGSVRLARGRGTEVHAVWWEARPDSGAALRAARSDDGGRRWRAPVPVDTLDAGYAGCRRPPPAIAVDSVLGYVHVVYYLDAPEGAGLFFSHSMERGDLYHEPVAIMYGERPSAGAVAAHGNTVAVAFEEPNAARPQVWFTLSTTAGHMFGPRTRLSGTSVAAAQPRIAVTDAGVVVEWLESADRGGAASGASAARVVTRVGRLPRGRSSTNATR